jgi:hypothetical protein
MTLLKPLAKYLGSGAVVNALAWASLSVLYRQGGTEMIGVAACLDPLFSA